MNKAGKKPTAVEALQIRRNGVRTDPPAYREVCDCGATIYASAEALHRNDGQCPACNEDSEFEWICDCCGDPIYVSPDITELADGGNTVELVEQGRRGAVVMLRIDQGDRGLEDLEVDRHELRDRRTVTGGSVIPFVRGQRWDD